MNTGALSIANYFIELAEKEGRIIRPLRLMKYVYLAHGYMLSMLGESAIDSQSDKVEAWEFGPVIPSVYHSFKEFKDKPINRKAIDFIKENEDGTLVTQTPILRDRDMMNVCVYVWNTYDSMSDWNLVDMLHKEDSPWYKYYQKGQNIVIPDNDTKAYCDMIAQRVAPSVMEVFTAEDYAFHALRTPKVNPSVAHWYK